MVHLGPVRLFSAHCVYAQFKWAFGLIIQNYNDFINIHIIDYIAF